MSLNPITHLNPISQMVVTNSSWCCSSRINLIKWMIFDWTGCSKTRNPGTWNRRIRNNKCGMVKRRIPNLEWLNVEQQIQNDKTRNNKSKMIKCGITNLLRPKEAYQYFSGIICCLIFILISIFVNRNQIEY